MRGRALDVGIIVLGTLCCCPLAFSQGLQLPGIGPVNRSMGGAAVAAPLDAIGALHWNPATISGLKSNELAVAMELITPIAEINSTIGAGALAPGFPSTTLFGIDTSDSGWSGIPSIGLVYRPQDSALTFGVGAYGIAGYGLNYGASTSNPVSFPQAPTAITPIPGFGRIHADVQLLQIAPVVSVQLNPSLSVAIGPTIMLARLSSIPFPFAPPDDANQDGTPTYPDGDGTRYHWGGGFEAGVFYAGSHGWNLGASIKSPNWFEKLQYRSHDELGLPRSFDFEIDYPMFLSLGTAYTGFERFLIAADVRWTDYSQTDGFGDTPAFASDGRLLGLGWESVWSTAIGVQYTATDRLSLRTGYTYAESPVTNENAGFNVAAPVVLRHSVNGGATYRIGAHLNVHAAYHYTVPSDVSSPLQSPGGPVPGTNVTYAIGSHAISLGMSTTF